MTRPSRFRIAPLLAPLAVVALGAGVAACGDDSDSDDTTEATAGEVVVTDAWVRQPASGQTVAAGYGTITNGTGGEITLVGASAPLTATFEIHETMMDDDGVMSMQEREEGFAIADGESFTLEPGGPHVMMLNVDPAEFTGDVELTFVFDGADPVTVLAELREISGEPMGDGEMEDGEMEDGEMDEG